jgi:hypothetical protein
MTSSEAFKQWKENKLTKQVFQNEKTVKLVKTTVDQRTTTSHFPEHKQPKDNTFSDDSQYELTDVYVFFFLRWFIKVKVDIKNLFEEKKITNNKIASGSKLKSNLSDP